MLRQSSRTIILSGILFISIGSALAQRDSDKPSSDRRAKATPRAASVTGNGVVAVSSGREGRTVEFTAILKNSSAVPLKNLKLAYVEPPEYNIDRICWIEGGTEQCQEISNNSGTLRIPIGPNRSTAIWGRIRIKKSHDKGKVTAIFSWIDDGGNTSDFNITLGDFTAQSCYQYYGKLLYGLVKDFALPTVLVLLGFAYQLWDKRCESERQEKEQERAHILQTWNSMLPISHKYATRYYMPVVANGNGVLDGLNGYFGALVDNAGNANEKTNEWSRRAFFTMAVLGRTLRHLSDNVGGFYFKDREGEELASSCLNYFRMFFYWENADLLKNFSLLLDHVDVKETFGKFSEKQSDENPIVKQIFANAFKDFVA